MDTQRPQWANRTAISTVRSDGSGGLPRLLAAAEERARIARDLHDSAGHAINVIAVRAGAARLRHHEDPDRSLAALEAIEELARRTAADFDRIVEALRETNAAGAVEAPPGLASLPRSSRRPARRALTSY